MNVCKSCGGNLKREGNYLVCQYCHTEWMVDAFDDVNAVARASAWDALRHSDFEKATELFEEIVIQDPNSHEGFWGKALAKASVVYVNDLNENRKVPTLNNVTENSFITDSDVKKAISLAPNEIAESYKKQADYVEKIRKEWIEKASKEPEYDVFISFKDSDRERGIERTPDSMAMQDLYTALVEKGYRVFYSRVSLKGKISEQYEPYIYNAIKTAKVMIVYGEKAEYFSSAWIKNEWLRFKKRVEKGEKHKNSLITVFKNVNPYDIPTALTGGRQALDYGVHSNYEVLLNHIALVVQESSRSPQRERIEIKGGQIGKKASQIHTENLQTREIGTSAVETDLNDKQTLSIVDTYVSANGWADAAKLVDSLLIKNPNNAEFKWYFLKIKYKSKTTIELLKQIESFSDSDFEIVEMVVNTANEFLATGVLQVLYAVADFVSEQTYLKILNKILPLNFENRARCISQSFSIVIKKTYFQAFKLLLQSLESSQVDDYIKYNILFAYETNNSEQKKWCLDKVFEVDEGNVNAFSALYEDYLAKEDLNSAIETFEKLLKYSDDINFEVSSALTKLSKSLKTQTDCFFAKHILKYYTDDFAKECITLSSVAFAMIKNGFFSQAKELCDLIITVKPDFAEAYWGLCLIFVKAKTTSDVYDCDELIKNAPEFNKYLVYANYNDKQNRISIAQSQEEKVKKRENQRKNELLAKEARENAEREKVATQKAVARKKRTKTIIVITAIITVIAVITCLILGSIADKNARAYCKMESYENGWTITQIEGGHPSDIVIPSTYKNLPVVRLGNDNGNPVLVDSSLSSLTLPSSLKSIGLQAFWGSSVYKIILNDGLERIADSAFENSKIVNINIPNSVTTLGEGIFAYCNKLQWARLGEGITEIPSFTFMYCSELKYLILGKNVTTVCEKAFYTSAYSLEKVFFESETPYNLVIESAGNAPFKNATKYYYLSENSDPSTGNYWYYDESGTPTILQGN